MMSLAFSNEIGASLFMKSGTRTQTKLILDITIVAASLGPEVFNCVLRMHSFTGCDIVSTFEGKGKAQALKEEHKEPRSVDRAGKRVRLIS